MRFGLGGKKSYILSEHLANNPVLIVDVVLKLLTTPNGKKKSIPYNLRRNLLAYYPLSICEAMVTKLCKEPLQPLSPARAKALSV